MEIILIVSFISILQTNPQRRATIKSLLNHDWVMKGYAAPVRWMSRIKVLKLFPEDFLYFLCVSAVLFMVSANCCVFGLVPLRSDVLAVSCMGLSLIFSFPFSYRKISRMLMFF